MFRETKSRETLGLEGPYIKCIIILICVVTKLTRPFCWYTFDLVPNTDHAHVVCLVFHAFMAAILKFYLIIMELLIPCRNKSCERHVVNLLY